MIVAFRSAKERSFAERKATTRRLVLAKNLNAICRDDIFQSDSTHSEVDVLAHGTSYICDPCRLVRQVKKILLLEKYPRALRPLPPCVAGESDSAACAKHGDFAAASMIFIAAHDNRLTAQSWVEMLLGVSAATLVFSQLLIGALGANAAATERGDRSAEFLFYLPVTRRQMLASKLLVALAIALAIWLWHLFVLEIVCPALSNALPSRQLPNAAVFASGVSLFGVAWLASSFLKSNSYSLLASLILFASIGAAFFNSVEFWHWPAPKTREVWFVGIHLVLGLVGYSAGTWYFTRRVEP
jgi:hypothetical protein